MNKAKRVYIGSWMLDDLLCVIIKFGLSAVKTLFLIRIMSIIRSMFVLGLMLLGTAIIISYVYSGINSFSLLLFTNSNHITDTYNILLNLI